MKIYNWYDKISLVLHGCILQTAISKNLLGRSSVEDTCLAPYQKKEYTLINLSIRGNSCVTLVTGFDVSDLI